MKSDDFSKPIQCLFGIIESYLHDMINTNFNNDFALGCSMAHSFSETLKILMKKKHITIEQMAEETGMNPRTIGRYLQGSSTPNLRIAVTICVVLKLDFMQSETLLGALGLKLRLTERTDCAYSKLLSEHRGLTVQECNRLLRSYGLEEKRLIETAQTSIFRGSLKCRSNLKIHILPIQNALQTHNEKQAA